MRRTHVPTVLSLPWPRKTSTLLKNGKRWKAPYWRKLWNVQVLASLHIQLVSMLRFFFFIQWKGQGENVLKHCFLTTFLNHVFCLFFFKHFFNHQGCRWHGGLIFTNIKKNGFMILFRVTRGGGVRGRGGGGGQDQVGVGRDSNFRNILRIISLLS